MFQKRFFFSLVVVLLAANLLAGIVLIVMRVNGTYDPAHPGVMVERDAAGAVINPEPTSVPRVGRDIPPPNPLRDGGPALPIMRILPVIMLLASLGVVVWNRSRKRAAQTDGAEHQLM